jgi:hypothetical protein
MNVQKNKLFLSTLNRSLPCCFKSNMGLTLLAIGAYFLALIVTPQSANAQSPQQFLKPHVDWLKNKTQGTGDYWLNLVLVSNTSPIGNSIQTARYGTAQIRLLNVGVTMLGGTANIYYSNRRTSTGNPFDQNQTVMQPIFLNPTSGQVTIGYDTIDAPQCLYGLMFGIGRPNFGTTYYVLTLTDQFAPPPTVPQ